MYSVFNIQLRAVCRVWFSVDTGDMVGAGYTHMFWEQPNGSSTGSTSSLLPHREDSIPNWSLCYHLNNYTRDLSSKFSRGLNKWGDMARFGNQNIYGSRWINIAEAQKKQSSDPSI
jgi:hypothetical protein